MTNNFIITNHDVAWTNRVELMTPYYLYNISSLSVYLFGRENLNNEIVGNLLKGETFFVVERPHYIQYTEFNETYTYCIVRIIHATKELCGYLCLGTFNKEDFDTLFKKVR